MLKTIRVRRRRRRARFAQRRPALPGAGSCSPRRGRPLPRGHRPIKALHPGKGRGGEAEAGRARGVPEGGGGGQAVGRPGDRLSGPGWKHWRTGRRRLSSPGSGQREGRGMSLPTGEALWEVLRARTRTSHSSPWTRSDPKCSPRTALGASIFSARAGTRSRAVRRKS